MSGTRKTRIEKTDELLWRLRFSHPGKLASKASAMLKRARDSGDLRSIAYAELNLAAADFFRSSSDKALKHLSEASAWFAQNRTEKGYARLLLLKGNIYESFGDYEKTLELWLEACKVSAEIPDIDSEGEACNQLGLIYFRLHNNPKAIEYLNRGLKIREDRNDENAVASSLNRIGMVLCQSRKFDESLGYYFRSLEIRIKNNQEHAVQWTYLGIASVYEDMGNYSQSLEYYERALDGDDKRCNLQCLMGSGRIYSLLGKRDAALERLEKSLLMAKELSSMTLIADAHKALAGHHEHFNEPAEALRSFKHYLEAKESFQSSEVQSRLSNIEIAHAIERAEQEKEIYRLRHVELKKAYDLIEEKNKDITSSINYAGRIQNAMLPRQNEIRGLAGKSFILYIPKDIVSGDFYWFTLVDGKMIIAAGDCTGHGVPGALMSMLGISFLEEIVNNGNMSDTGLILDELRTKVKKALHQKGTGEEAKDGMDLSLCIIDKKNNLLRYSGAYNNLYHIRCNELTEYRADRMPIGIHDSSDKKFTQHEIHTAPGDIIYMFSDGYADQFGGPGLKKFKYSAFRSLLLEIHCQSLKEQKSRLESEFYKWKGNNPQTDDVMVIGIRI